MGTKTKLLSYWSNLNTLWESSGLPQQAFCKQEGVKYKQFVYWRGRIRTRPNASRPEPKPQLLNVLLPATKTSSMIIDPQSMLEVVMPTGVKLYVKTEQDVSKAVTLIRLLGGAS